MASSKRAQLISDRLDNAPVELVHGRLWLLGSVTPADSDRISWLPEGAHGFESLNAYLVLEPERALLVDAGVAAFADALVEQLDSLIDRAFPLSVYLTRIEGDCIGGLSRLGELFNLTHIYSAGLINPFDFFDDIATQMTVERETGLIIERIQHGSTLEVGPGRTLDVLRALLRLLSTSWLYDRATRTLFTSDSFSHARLDQREGPCVVSGSDDRTTAREVADHLTTKFDWLEHADDPTIVAADVTAIFEEFPVERIGPCRGAVIEGEAAVARHRELVVRAILDAPT